MKTVVFITKRGGGVGGGGESCDKNETAIGKASLKIWFKKVQWLARTDTRLEGRTSGWMDVLHICRYAKTL